MTNPYRDLERNHEVNQLLSSIEAMIGRVKTLQGPRQKASFWRRLKKGWRAFMREMRNER